MKYHCFFEQSGTFKNELKKLGGVVKDYDILNDYGQTDKIIDLFKQIERGYLELPSLFDKMDKNDTILAFFPCIRFEEQIKLCFRGTNHGLKNWSVERKLQYDLLLGEELQYLYSIITKLAIVCIRKDIKLIIENPYSKTHFLTQYWAIPSKVIDLDRRKNGDYYRKSTQFWFINCEPKDNPLVNDELIEVEHRTINEAYKANNNKSVTVTRSEIHPQYARRFIKRYIADFDGEKYKV